MRQLLSWIGPKTRFTRPRLSAMVHLASFIAANENPDRVRSFRGYDRYSLSAPRLIWSTDK